MKKYCIMTAMDHVSVLDAHIHLADIAGGNPHILVGTLGSRVRFFCNATSPVDWENVLALARSYPNIAAFIGLHPWMTVSAINGWDAELEKRAFGAAGIGEIGLDTLKGGPAAEQKKVFIRQLEIACALKKPFVLHCVRAWGDVTGILHRFCETGLPMFMVHAFGASEQVLDELLSLGGYISFSLKDMERRGEKLRPLLRRTPVDRLLLETDFPNCHYEESMTLPAAYIDCLNRLYSLAAAYRGEDDGYLKDVIYSNGTVFTHPSSAR